MKKLIFEICRHGDEDQVQHLVFQKFPVSIGRGFNNDIIVSDPYADAEHLQVDYDGETCIVSDLGSENGFTINGKEPRGRRAPIKPGDTLQIGHTEIRAFTPQSAVPPAVPQQKNAPLLNWLAQPLAVWVVFLITMAATIGWAYMEIWVSEEEGLMLAGVAAATTGILLLWSVAWSVAGRLTRHKAHFKSHIGLICLYMLAGTVSWYIEVYTDFLTNENWFSRLVTYGLNFILLGLLLYGSMTLATRLSPQRRLRSASFLSFGILAGVFIFTLVGAKSFNQQPLYPSTLKPYLAALAPADTVDKFMEGNEELFSSDEFSQQALAKK